MASRKTIKGISIQLSADATGLTNALQNINKKIDSTSSNLKEVNKLLKFDGSNTELIAQKQRLLGEQIDNTKKKLKALKDQQDNLNKALENDDITQEQYDAWQREIIETEQQLKSLGDELDDTEDSSDRVGQSFSGWGEKIGAVATLINDEILQPLTDKLVDIGKDSFGAFASFEQGMAEVKAISGATTEEMDALNKKALEVASTSAFTSAEIADGFKYMAMAGWKPQQMLDGIEAIEALASATGSDLGSTSDIITDALTAFGLTAEDAAHFADVLAVASSNANTNVAMMGETFKYVSSVAGAYGYSIEDVAESIGIIANSGIKASQAGTALRSIMTRIATDAGASKNKMGAGEIIEMLTGKPIFDAQGNMRDWGDIIDDTREAWAGLTEEQQSSYAKQIAANTGIAAWQALMNASTEDTDKLSDAIENADGTTQKMKETMLDTSQGSLTMLSASIDTLKVTIGEELAPKIQTVIDKIQELVNWVGTLDGDQITLAANIGIGVAAFGLVAGAISKVIAFIASLRLALGTASIAGATGAGAAAAATGAAGTGGLIGTLGAVAVVLSGVAYIATQVIAQISMITKNMDSIKMNWENEGAIGWEQDWYNRQKIVAKKGWTSEQLGEAYEAVGGIDLSAATGLKGGYNNYLQAFGTNDVYNSAEKSALWTKMVNYLTNTGAYAISPADSATWNTEMKTGYPTQEQMKKTYERNVERGTNVTINFDSSIVGRAVARYGANNNYRANIQ